MSQLDFQKFVKNRLANLVSFDNTGTDLTATQVQAAIVELAGNNFGKNFSFQSLTATTSVKNNNVVQLNTISPTGLPAGNYFVLAQASIQKVAIRAEIETWIQVGATQLFRNQIAMDDDDKYFSHTKFHLLNTSGNQTITFNMQRVNGNNSILAQNRTLIIWRLN